MEPTWEAGRVGMAVLTLFPALYTDPNAMRAPQMSVLVVFTQFYNSMFDCFSLPYLVHSSFAHEVS